MFDRKLEIFKTPLDLAKQIADDLFNSVQQKSTEKFYLTISGGSTPKILFKVLADDFKDKNDWNRIHLFWADERCVPPDDDESNYGMTKKILIDKINIDENNIHRIKGENDPVKEAKRYAAEIQNIVPLNQNNLPQFDWILLGMGEDGHTASLFPNQNLKYISKNLMGVASHPETAQKRISMTEQLINNAARITFLITGKEKSHTLKKIIEKEKGSDKFPAAKINSVHNISEWRVDEVAASLL